MKRTGMTITQLLIHQKKSGMIEAKEEGKHMMALIKENHKLLDSCDLHNFTIELKTLSGRVYECSKCGGEVSSEAKMWYEKGIKHIDDKRGKEWNL